MSRADRREAVASRRWTNLLAPERDIYASIYWIYEDFSRNYENQPESDWPCKEVGAGTLELMLSNWSPSSMIRGHGNPINRCCSFTRPEFTAMVWWGNCLQLFSELDDDDIKELSEYLTRP